MAISKPASVKIWVLIIFRLINILQEYAQALYYIIVITMII